MRHAIRHAYCRVWCATVLTYAYPSVRGRGGGVIKQAKRKPLIIRNNTRTEPRPPGAARSPVAAPPRRPGTARRTRASSLFRTRGVPGDTPHRTPGPQQSRFRTYSSERPQAAATTYTTPTQHHQKTASDAFPIYRVSHSVPATSPAESRHIRDSVRGRVRGAPSAASGAACPWCPMRTYAHHGALSPQVDNNQCGPSRREPTQSVGGWDLPTQSPSSRAAWHPHHRHHPHLPTQQQSTCPCRTVSWAHRREEIRARLPPRPSRVLPPPPLRDGSRP